MKALLALLLAATAIAVQAHTPPPRFVRGMLERGMPVQTERLVGIEWRCGDETCWAGYTPRGWRTGP